MEINILTNLLPKIPSVTFCKSKKIFSFPKKLELKNFQQLLVNKKFNTVNRTVKLNQHFLSFSRGD